MESIIKLFIVIITIIFPNYLYATDINSTQCPNNGIVPFIEANSKLSNHDKIKICPLISAGDSISSNKSSNNNKQYRLVGVGDGIGILKNDIEESTIYLNHELESKQGVIRKHGAKGAFVSMWKINNKTHEIISGADLINQSLIYDFVNNKYEVKTTEYRRLCSADLPKESAFFYKENNKLFGTKDRIFISGEEISTKYDDSNGRAFAHIITGDHAGKSFDLPRMGKMAFENILLNPYSQKKTIAILMDDSGNKTFTKPRSSDDIKKIHSNPPSELYIYIGNKSDKGKNPIEKSGLNNGNLYGVKIPNLPWENRKYGLGTKKYKHKNNFIMFNLGDVSNDVTGKSLQIRSINNEITQFLRIEDGAWYNDNEFYFTTTDEFIGISRLYKLTFLDITAPEKGGSIEIVINGTKDGHTVKMLDNITIDPWGRILLQEDPGYGDNNRLAKIWMYEPKTDKLHMIAEHKKEFFLEGIDDIKFLSENEESTGIIEAFDSLGKGWYLLYIQTHHLNGDIEIVRDGQLVSLYIPKEL